MEYLISDSLQGEEARKNDPFSLAEVPSERVRARYVKNECKSRLFSPGPGGPGEIQVIK
jgi:hypothetical protein